MNRGLHISKVNPNFQTNDGLTALHLAAGQGHFSTVELLEQSGADINICHKVFGTPLHCAAREKQLKIAAYLLIHKARIDLFTETGKSAIDVSTDEKITQMIAKYKENLIIKAKNKIEMPLEVLKGLVLRQGITYKSLYIPPKPTIIFSEFYEVSTILKLKTRCFFVIDPIKLTFTKYQNPDSYPIKPIYCFPIPRIQCLRMLPSNNQWHFFEFYFERLHKFCFRNEEPAKLLVKYLNCAIIYGIFLEQLINTIKSNELPENVKDFDQELLEFVIRDFGNPVIIRDYQETEVALINDSDLSNNMLLSQFEESKEFFNLEEGINFSSFKLLEKIGSGAFGSIYKVEKKSTKEIYAMKIVSKKALIKSKQLKYALAECKTLKIVNHPFIVRMHYSFQTPENIYFILDYCGAGDLSVHIGNKQVFKEDEAKFYIAELILAIEYLHSLKIVYRDLKPENILIGIFKIQI